MPWANSGRYQLDSSRRELIAEISVMVSQNTKYE